MGAIDDRKGIGLAYCRNPMWGGAAPSAAHVANSRDCQLGDVAPAPAVEEAAPAVDQRREADDGGNVGPIDGEGLDVAGPQRSASSSIVCMRTRPLECWFTDPLQPGYYSSTFGRCGEPRLAAGYRSRKECG